LKINFEEFDYGLKTLKSEAQHISCFQENCLDKEKILVYNFFEKLFRYLDYQ
jgi:hypothetical protein